MRALTFDTTREQWDQSIGMVLEEVPEPILDETTNGADRSRVLIRVRYAGFCGSDRGIWWRKSFGDMVQGSLAKDGKTKRIFGHELLGEIVAVGSRVTPKYGYKVGDTVSTESHIVCGTCHQCRIGDEHVCARDRIIGVSTDGCFADYVKLPAKALWPTDLSKIRPEVAAVQEPFGNAVHACQVTDLRGQTVAIFGTGTIGLFAVLIARGMGAKKVIGIDPSPERRALAKRLGCDEVLVPGPPDPERPFAADREMAAHILDLTDGVGADVTMEMAGVPSSVNNAIRAARRGGKVVLFGVRNGDTVLEDAHRVVMNGLHLHGVVGRRLFQTWEVTKALLESRDNGIQDAVYNLILNGGDGTIVDMAHYNRELLEERIGRFPKVVLNFQ
jgi:threonine 3-dehydrogenase